ncbi:uncharacterized protein [Aquarana catesbeiana]|uniref:uncharacterized protein n=1 Tax=Aquarana catesbeiana TaxID=8400 RepID=UPI003CC9CD9B
MSRPPTSPVYEDPVLISSITSTGGWLSEEMAVSVQFSGEESAVTWEVDGEPLPERYRLIDDNRTLIIPSVQRDDAERRFRVRITNPVSEEIREYRLEIRDSELNFRTLPVHPMAAGISIHIQTCCKRERKNVPLSIMEVGYEQPTNNQSSSIHGMPEDPPLNIMEVGYGQPIHNESTSTHGIPEDLPLSIMEVGYSQPIHNKSTSTHGIPDDLP